MPHKNSDEERAERIVRVIYSISLCWFDKSLGSNYVRQANVVGLLIKLSNLLVLECSSIVIIISAVTRST
jgi:hypothetical protein